MTIQVYEPEIEKRSEMSRRFTRILGKRRAVDVYWNSENENYIITRKGNKTIFHEFLFGEDISAEKIRLKFCKVENAPSLRERLKLQDVAIMANKAKENTNKREQFEYAGAEDYDYRIAGKRSINLGA